MTNQEKLKEACRIMREVSESMGRDRGYNIKFYPQTLPSFDELVSEIASIELMD